MDFEEDSFASAPVRYALDDHDSDEELEASTQLQKIKIEADIQLPDTNNKWTFVFGLEGPGHVFLQSLDHQEATVIGTVVRKVEGEDKVLTEANVGQLSNQAVLLIPIVGTVSDEEAGSFVRAIFNKMQNRVDKVVVLDAFIATSYFSKTYDENKVPPYLRALPSSTAPPLTNVDLYETPNTIKGLPAAIMNYCEVHSIAAYDFLTLQESVYGQLLVTSDILDAYTEGFKKLGYSFTYNEQVMTQVLEKQRKGRINDAHHRLYL